MKTKKSLVISLSVLVLLVLALLFLYIRERCEGPYSSPRFLIPGGADYSYVVKDGQLYYCRTYLQTYIQMVQNWFVEY